jgi:hypothetical protein
MKITEKMILVIKELATIELDEGCHNDYKEDYDSLTDFYLSALKDENDYKKYVLRYVLDEYEGYYNYFKTNIDTIIDDVRFYIVEKVEEMENKKD